MNNFKCRASSLGRLMTNQPSSDSFGKGTRDVIREDVLYQAFGYRKEIDAQMLKKGNELEDEAIKMVSLMQAKKFTKNKDHRDNKWFTGSCDISDKESIRDTKVSWSIESFPFTQADAEAIVKASGYDWQVMAYMMLWGVKTAFIDFVLLPTPKKLLKPYDDEILHIDTVKKIAPDKRVRTVKIDYDPRWMTLAKLRVEDVQPYHAELYENIAGAKPNE